jgi:hypothetical protein
MDYKEKAIDVIGKFGNYSVLFVTEMISELKELNKKIGEQTGNDIDSTVSFWEKVKYEIEK